MKPVDYTSDYGSDDRRFDSLLGRSNLNFPEALIKLLSIFSTALELLFSRASGHLDK